MNTPQTGRHEALDNALETHDLQEVKNILNGMVTTQKYVAFAQILSFKPWPKDIIKEVHENITVYAQEPGGWITTAAKTGYDIDWHQFLNWLEPHRGQHRLHKDLENAWYCLADDWERYDMRAFRPTGVDVAGLRGAERALAGILDYRPHMAKKAITHNSNFSGLLFLLSALIPSKTDWAKKGGLDLEALILAGSRTRRFDLVARPTGEQIQDTPLGRWLDASTRRQDAWTAVVTQDKRLAALEQDWRDTWIAGDAPNLLSQWCSHVRYGAPYEGGHPLDHPAFQFEGATKQPGSDMILSASYLNAGLVRGRGLDLNDQIKIHNGWREKMGPSVHPRHLLNNIPLHPLAEAMDCNRGWALDIAGTEAGAKEIQGLLEDPRAYRLLNGIDPKKIVKMIIDEPSWRTWRNQKGQGLLEMRLEADRLVGRSMFLSKQLLFKLSRLTPDLLTDVNSKGETVLDRMMLADQARSDIKRDLLKRMLARTATQRRAPGMAM